MSSHYELAWNKHLSLMSVRITQNEEISATQQRELAAVIQQQQTLEDEVKQLRQTSKFV